MMAMKKAIILAVALVAATGCNTLPTACTMEFGVEVAPAARTLAVGSSFTPAATAVTCGGRHRQPYHATWRTADAEVVRVDPTTGRITGLAPGVAVVTAHEPGGSAAWAWGEVRVTVVAP